MEGQPPRKKNKNLFSFFQRTGQPTESTTSDGLTEDLPSFPSEVEHHSSSNISIEREPGKRKAGPYQPRLVEYPRTQGKSQSYRFRAKWFNQFPWLEYSPTTDRVYFFYCYLFRNDGNPSNCSALVTSGYNQWKRVNDGAKCVFLTHLRSSKHNMCERRAKDLMKPSQHIDKVIHTISNEEVERRRLRLKTSIRRHVEKNTEIDKVVLKNAPKNAQYIALSIQKEILHIMVNKVRRMVREEVGNGYFCILVNEAQNASKREQMAIILRFVNGQGILTERYFDIKSVSDTTSSSLKNETVNVLEVLKIRGQGYDGANNMRGAWNGLQALFLRDCPYAYYIHCLAHRLQLVLVYTAKEVDVIWEFFSHMDNIINIITSSPKRVTELQSAQRIEIELMLAIGERESGSGANQVGNLQRSGETRWSSHCDSIKSLIDIYNSTCAVFENLSVHCPNGKSRGEVRDILTAVRFVFTTTKLLHKLRDDDWEEFLEEVKKFCSKHDIEIPDLESLYKVGPCRSRDPITMKHHYHFHVFSEAIDYVLMELNTRFNDTSVELLTLSAALDPRDSFASFNSYDICTLAEKFYPEDFPKEDIRTLEYELRHYELDMKTESRFQVSTLIELCRQLTESRRSEIYVMVTRLICLVLTLPISTATTERAFSAMKHVKTDLRNKMEMNFLLIV
ncbi:zinc finger MYM-type protein 1-like [Olea europaea var. sylvestris]|uniref:zinc finger MYM-type protein 1-like n=1 Tax=Olea europaea var. sylvestris TaxID=158386 RepID=UPI000C1D33D8|nr:zinc finger MYM-type protein 1-like [Olea europaea var. sylvestris]